MAKHIKNAPPELEEAAPGVEIPAPVEAVVRRALEKLPENRPASAEQMLNELEQALVAARAVESGVRPHIASEDLPESLRLAQRRSWVLGLLLAAALVALIAVGAKFTTALQPATPTVSPSNKPSAALENSASIAASDTVATAPLVAPTEEAAPPAASSAHSRSAPAGSVSTKKPATKTAPTSPLERRGNERYGRFD